MTIYNLGSVNIDRYIHVDRLPVEGDTLDIKGRSTDLGGKGVNISVAAHRAGADVRHIGAIGRGDTDTRQMIEATGVETAMITEIDDCPTGEALIMLAKTGGNCILIDGGANRRIPEGHIDSSLASAQNGDWLVLQNETNGLDFAITRAREKGMKIALVAAPFDVDMVRDTLPRTDLVSVNQTEFEQIQAALDLSDPALANIAFVVTYGADRAEYIQGGRVISVNSHTVKAINTTGAGDTFFGYFIAALDQRAAPKAALDLANAAAALKVQRRGTSAGIPTLDEVTASRNN